MRPVEYHYSDDYDFTCAACNRGLKRAVTMSDGRTLGLDCAAVAMGRPKSRSTYAAIENEALTATVQTAGRAYGAANPAPPNIPFRNPARMEWLATATKASGYAENSAPWHTFISAAISS